ncbi:MAG: ABC transporter transmembrane domain-containing protein [Sulfitobacter sp.]
MLERSLFGFIWKHSKYDQLTLLAVTLTLFPLLYLTLELPKRIINDAIGAATDTVTVFGVDLSQTTYLFVLCGVFLLAVLLHGLMKMRINTMKGALAERLLRRFRYTLIARILRFPAAYFGRTSQGELVSMVTSEAEPMGGLMGDAVAQPVLQAGQMLTILGFLFIQDVAFGLAACALIPFQAWLIPKLQRQVNRLNIRRVVQVRALAAEIGASAEGAIALRTHGGWRYRLAMFSDRLGKLYFIRFEVFQKKFFMKFLNNFITQLTPFFFYAVGGYLVIQGDITIGALVAALAAYKDLSSPWKELLAYYNQHQDMSVRWSTITERFAPPGMIDAALFEQHPVETPSLAGDIELSGVSARDEDGEVVLDDITITFPAGQCIAVAAQADEDRRALSALLTRELVPSSGKITIAGFDLLELHQATLASRIGHATSHPVLFAGNFEDNMLMPLRDKPVSPAAQTEITLESARAGNSTETLDSDWLNLKAAAVSDTDELRDWWLKLVNGMGSADAFFHRGLDQRFDPEQHSVLAKALVDVRPEVVKAITKAKLDGDVWTIDEATYNPAFPVIDNLLFATPREPMTADVLAEHTKFLDLLTELNLEEDLMHLAADMVEMIRQIFGVDGADHPLFRRLGLQAKSYETALTLIDKKNGRKALTNLEKAQLLIVPFSISAEIIGPSFPIEITEKVLTMRATHGPALRESMKDIFTSLSPDQPVAGLSVLENALFGKTSQAAGRKGEELNIVVGNVLREAELDALILGLTFDMPIRLGGGNLATQIAEPLAVSRATIKRPDILILDSVFSSHPSSYRQTMYENMVTLLPDTTIICLESSFEDTSQFDMHVEMRRGRIFIGADTGADEAGGTITADQAKKMRVLEQADLFNGLERKQLRLLAFGARWHTAKAGEYLFYKDDDPSSGAYLIIEGKADLLLPQSIGEDTIVTEVGPGALVGELGLIRNVPRALDMRATTEMTSLRIGAEEFLAVVEHDAATAYKLLQVVAGYVGK